MTKSVIAGVALATAVMAGQSADAGHRHRHRDCNCQPACATAHQGGWYYTRSAGGFYVPMARSENVAPASSFNTTGPPMAPGPGHTIRRFSWQ